MSKNNSIIYSVCYTKYHDTSRLFDEFAEFRRNHLINGEVERYVRLSEEDGIRRKLSYEASPYKINWIKLKGCNVIESTSIDTLDLNNTVVTFTDEESGTTEKIYYNKRFHWIKTEFYEGDSRTPSDVLELHRDSYIMLKEFRKNGYIRKRTKLYPCISSCGSNRQNRLDEMTETPQIYMNTSIGELCFVQKEYLEKREAFMNGLIESEQEKVDIFSIPLPVMAKAEKHVSTNRIVKEEKHTIPVVEENQADKLLDEISKMLEAEEKPAPVIEATEITAEKKEQGENAVEFVRSLTKSLFEEMAMAKDGSKRNHTRVMVGGKRINRKPEEELVSVKEQAV